MERKCHRYSTRPTTPIPPTRAAPTPKTAAECRDPAPLNAVADALPAEFLVLLAFDAVVFAAIALPPLSWVPFAAAVDDGKETDELSTAVGNVSKLPAVSAVPVNPADEASVATPIALSRISVAEANSLDGDSVLAVGYKNPVANGS